MRCRSRARGSRAGTRRPARAGRRFCCCATARGYRTIVRIHTYDRTYRLGIGVVMAIAHSLAAAAVRTAGLIMSRWGAAVALPLFAHVAAPAPVDPADEATMWRADRSSVRIPGIDRAGADVTVYEWGRSAARSSCSPTAGTGGPASSRRSCENSSARDTGSSLSTHRRTATRRPRHVHRRLGRHPRRAPGAPWAVRAVVGHSFGGLATLIGASRGVAVDRVVTVAAPCRCRPAAGAVPGHAGLRRSDGARAARTIRAPLLPR